MVFLQSWTKVLGHFCISGVFSNSRRSNPSPHPTNNVGLELSRIFSEFQGVIGWGEEKGCTVLRGNWEMTEKYEYCSIAPRTFVQDCGGFQEAFPIADTMLFCQNTRKTGNNAIRSSMTLLCSNFHRSKPVEIIYVLNVIQNWEMDPLQFYVKVLIFCWQLW